jgi:hypothetical protein
MKMKNEAREDWIGLIVAAVVILYFLYSLSASSIDPFVITTIHGPGHKPSDCDYDRSPIGDKACHYERKEASFESVCPGRSAIMPNPNLVEEFKKTDQLGRTDRQVIEVLSEPTAFRKAFPDLANFTDDQVKWEMSRYHICREVTRYWQEIAEP